MFYSEYVLAKKGPLGKFWLAAHWNKKLTRAQIIRSDVVEACATIVKPAAPLALRTSGHLLLGVVRIHDSKQKALMNDCSDALIKIKLAFRPGFVDMPAGTAQAPLSAITLTDNLADLDIDVPDDEIDLAEDDFVHMGRHEDITLPEEKQRLVDADLLNPTHMDDFGDLQFGGLAPSIEMRRDASGMDAADMTGVTDLDTTPDAAPQDKSFPDAEPGQFSFQDSKLEIDGFGDEHFPAMDVPEAAEMREDEFGLSTPAPPEMPEPQLEPLEPLSPTAAGVVKVRKKRKLKIDTQTELPGTVIRAGLEPQGPDDITRQPFTVDKKRPLAYDPAPAVQCGIKRRVMQTDGAEALLEAPLSKRFPSALAAMLARNVIWVPTADAPNEEEKQRLKEPPLEDARYDPEEQPEIPFPEMDVPDADPVKDMTLHDESSFQFPDGDANMTSITFDEEPAETRQMTSEEFEESGWSRRTQLMIKNLGLAFESNETLSYKAMTQNKTRKTAAACLFELLVLKTKNLVHIEQDEPYADISVTPTGQFPETSED